MREPIGECPPLGYDTHTVGRQERASEWELVNEMVRPCSSLQIHVWKKRGLRSATGIIVCAALVRVRMPWFSKSLEFGVCAFFVCSLT